MSTPARGRRPSRTFGVRLVVVLVAVLAVSLFARPAPAQAHPFGDPQTVQIARDGDAVQVVWRIGMLDDLTLLGVSLGVLPEDRVLLDGALDYRAGDPEAVTESAALHDYLAERISVESGGTECRGEVAAVGDLLDEGATLRFICPEPADSVAVTVRTLTDLHQAYRTLASGPQGQREAYGSDRATHRWDLPAVGAAGAGADRVETVAHGAGSDLATSAGWQIGAVLGGVLVLILVGVGLRRSRRSIAHLAEHHSEGEPS